MSALPSFDHVLANEQHAHDMAQDAADQAWDAYLVFATERTAAETVAAYAAWMAATRVINGRLSGIAGTYCSVVVDLQYAFEQWDCARWLKSYVPADDFDISEAT